jgi:hypothetical protein
MMDVDGKTMKRPKRGVNIYHLASHDARTTVLTERDDPLSPHMAKDQPMNIGSKKGACRDLQGPSVSALDPYFEIRVHIIQSWDVDI